MTHYQFLSLNKDEQHNVLWQNGVYLMPLLKPQRRFMLWRLFDFFFELEYDPIANELLRLRSFTSDNALEPYLEKIDISFLC